jgi:hypothetical protein
MLSDVFYELMIYLDGQKNGGNIPILNIFSLKTH